MKKRIIVTVVLSVCYFIYVNIDDTIECDMDCLLDAYEDIDALLPENLAGTQQ